MLLIACVSLLALLLFGVPITFSLMGAGIGSDLCGHFHFGSAAW